MSTERAPTILEPSSYQQAIFDWCTSASGNLICNAVAGSGKSTTAKAVAIDHIPFFDSILAITFGKRDTESLSAIMPANCKCATSHSFGLSVTKQRFPKIKVDFDKTKWRLFDNYDKSLVWPLVPAISKLISLAKTNLYTPQDLLDNYISLADYYSIDLPDELEEADYPEPFSAILDKTYQACLADDRVIDFDDMLFYPIYHNLPFPKYDWVIGDEVQDWNKAQIALITNLVQAGARAICFGDPRQSIYGFRGADIYSMDNLQSALSATRLPLSISYRCARAIVNLAKTIAPEIEASPTAIEGQVSNIQLTDYNPIDGSLVLCRTTAPLVSACLSLIRQRRKATVLGRKFGEDLLKLVDRITEDHNLPAEAFSKLSAGFFSRAISAALNRNQTNKAVNLADQQETLDVFISDCENSDSAKTAINQLFSDSSTGITHSTIHKAKGMESNCVYILRPDLLPHPMAKQDWEREQETHMEYVAYTRAKQQLIIVEGK